MLVFPPSAAFSPRLELTLTHSLPVPFEPSTMCEILQVVDDVRLVDEVPSARLAPALGTPGPVSQPPSQPLPMPLHSAVLAYDLSFLSCYQLYSYGGAGDVLVPCWC